MLSIEKHLWQQGFVRIGGIDEAGRGPLAGPVVAAVAVFDKNFALDEEVLSLKAINDSKKMCRKLRESSFIYLAECDNVEIAAGLADVDEIGRLNILQATFLAMKRAVAALDCPPDYAIVDGNKCPDLPCPCSCAPGGDGISLSVAAASIVAKVLRDSLMMALDKKYPGYGFASHKGYASRRHMQALLEMGPAKIHRKSFRPVREAAIIKQIRHEDENGKS